MTQKTWSRLKNFWMTRAFVDTSVLTNVALKIGKIRNDSLAALSRYDSTELPVYAIKEFKAGPLYNWVWIHNKLKVGGSVMDAVQAIQKLHPLQAHRKATALEALVISSNSVKDETVGWWLRKYGESAKPEAIRADRIRISMRRRIMRAWAARRSITTAVVQPLGCYDEVAPFEGKDGLLTAEPFKCRSAKDCQMAAEMKARASDLILIRDALSLIKNKPENSRRLSTIRDLVRLPKREITEAMCRSLGDSVFAMLAPADSVILTTNDSDHRPLAEALGKRVETP